MSLPFKSGSFEVETEYEMSITKPISNEDASVQSQSASI